MIESPFIAWAALQTAQEAGDGQVMLERERGGWAQESLDLGFLPLSHKVHTLTASHDKAPKYVGFIGPQALKVTCSFFTSTESGHNNHAHEGWAARRAVAFVLCLICTLLFREYIMQLLWNSTWSVYQQDIMKVQHHLKKKKKEELNGWASGQNSTANYHITLIITAMIWAWNRCQMIQAG